MKDLTNQDDLVQNIPKTAREFRFGNMILIITKSKQGTYGFVIKNKDNPKHHYTLVAKDKPDFHYTTESKGNNPNQHQHLDLEYFSQELGKEIERVFSSAKKIKLDDVEYHGKKILILHSQKMVISEKTRKKVIFDQEIEYEEIFFENLDTSENYMGFVFDDNDQEQEILIVQNGEIFIIDIDVFEPENSNLDKMFRPSMS